ncbi:hypothetical protein [Embleya sp. NPDC005971]|uniref:hypothetical protein n=1 Tax=Embleya sp. NPDC005971 TaxID=3156724 RepID=UPI0033DF4121
MSEASVAAARLERVRASLSGARAESPGGRRLRMNRPANVLVGALLHGAERREKGLEPSDLEERLFELVGEFVPEDELAAFGRVYTEARALGPIGILPEPITGLALETGYSLADLAADLPAITAHVVAQPNVRIVDAGTIAENEPIDDERFLTALAEYGRGTTIVTGGPEPQGEAASGDLEIELRLDSFTCERAQSGESGTDEIYWGLAAGSDRRAEQSSKTRVYGSTVRGTRHVVDWDTLLFSGALDRHVSCEIQCWEEDNSGGDFYNQLRRALGRWAEAALDLSTTLTKADNDAAGWAAWFAIGAGLLNALLGWLTNDDDLICERSYGFDRSALLAYASGARRVGFSFDGGTEGRHNLVIEFAGTNLRWSRRAAGGAWTGQALLPRHFTSHTPALAVFRDRLVCVHRGNRNDNRLWTTTYDGTSWGPDTLIPGVPEAKSGPALAVFGDRLHCLYRGEYPDRDAYLLQIAFDGTRWTDVFADPPMNARSVSGASAAAYNGRLYCVHRGHTNEMLWVNTFDGRGWSGDTPIPNAYSSAAPAVAVFDRKLYCVHRGHSNDNGLWVTYLDGNRWSPDTKILNATCDRDPALVVFEGRLHCVHRGGYQDEALWQTSFDGTRWSPDTRIPDAYSHHGPALAEYRNVLYRMNRG